jgi:putative DNA primase/helicase
MRSGKGTIAKILRQLLGAGNVAGPTLGSLATHFGLQSLIGRPLAIIADARLSGRTDQAIVVERLLSISGEDVQTVDRKHREPWTGILPTRVLVLTNELPRLTDTSGALASRFIVLTMKQSWLGKEDVHLYERLLPELPAILGWALDGLDRLRDRGRFAPPQSSINAIQDLEDLSSPVGAFLRDRCVVGQGRSVACTRLYEAWTTWCKEQGREHPGTTQTFARDLHAAIPGLGSTRPTTDDGRVRMYEGVGLRGGL